MKLISPTLEVTFPRPHAAPYSQTHGKAQPHDFSMTGLFYLYDRGVTIKKHRLIWNLVDDVTLSSVYDLFDTRLGGTREVTWMDPLLRVHSCSLDGTITVKELFNGLYSVALTLLEQAVSTGSILMDSLDSELMDSSGTVLNGVGTL